MKTLENLVEFIGEDKLQTLYDGAGLDAYENACYGLSLSENAYKEWSQIWIATPEEVLTESENAYRDAIVYIDEFLRGEG